jgi:hypothetical protein
MMPSAQFALRVDRKKGAAYMSRRRYRRVDQSPGDTYPRLMVSSPPDSSPPPPERTAPSPADGVVPTSPWMQTGMYGGMRL